MPSHLCIEKTYIFLVSFYFSLIFQIGEYIDFLIMCVGGYNIYEFHFRVVKGTLDTTYYKREVFGL